MVIRKESWKYKLLSKLAPQWLLYMSVCRVGSNFTTYVKVQFTWCVK